MYCNCLDIRFDFNRYVADKFNYRRKRADILTEVEKWRFSAMLESKIRKILKIGKYQSEERKTVIDANGRTMKILADKIYGDNKFCPLNTRIIKQKSKEMF